MHVLYYLLFMAISFLDIVRTCRDDGVISIALFICQGAHVKY